MPRDVVPVERENHVRPVADGNAAARVGAGLLEHFNLIQQRARIEHHAVADDHAHAGMQHAAGDQLQDELLAAHLDRVAGVVPALVAGHEIEFLRKQIDDFALAFVAPLRPENDEIAH